MFKNLVNKFSIFEIIVIALMATLGIATKPVIVPLAHIITGPLFIPGGAIAGGLYMMWIVLGMGLIGKVGVATLISLVQSIMVVSLGIYGTHGIVSFFTYIIPGLVVDLYLLLIKRREFNPGNYFIAGILANISGTFLVNLVFFRLPLIPLVLTLTSASLSGGIGGLIAYNIIKGLKKNNALKNLIDKGGHDE
ncbi:ECF transporter S component [Tepidimicrobium xylanilyticum]|uniref:Energy-coupling factor transport system substrate-specific component n=1 Tax=Tepidimicrobium xylanilyticum TaxID=1123352 RepID=A0A1H2T8D8_9FIRM|nr:ECF transporter S component [Tepidimicrobium xylanilyticum]SDW40098.1 energy-coupling factor transport system substrate-specific component [Tepidimicrobium xylanilyticum]